MVQKTRRKLLLIYWGTSALLFTALLVLLASMNYKKARQGEYYFFDNKAAVISQQIAFTRSLPEEFFRHMQESNQIFVYSQTNQSWYGQPLSEKRRASLQKAVSSLEKQIESQSPAFAGYLPFNLECTSTDILPVSSYFGKKLKIETISGSSDTVLILYDVSGKFLPAAEVFLYVLLELGGLALLFLLCSFFIVIATKPIARSIQQQNEFVASASHELKSPLAVIQLNAETLRTVDDETGAQLLSTIISECRRLTSMIQNMLLLASSDSRRLSVKRAPLETDRFFIGIYEHYYSYCKQKGHLLSLSMDDRLPPVIRADKALLTQVMGILMDNAVSYSPPGTPFYLSAGQSRGFLKVSLENTAPSLSEEQQEKLFNRFYQADSSHSSPSHSGLGLSIAKEIIESHGGRIYLESCQNNQFIFSFQIPL